MATGLINKFLGGQDGYADTLSAPINAAVTTITPNSLSGYTNGDKVIMTIDRVDSNGNRTPSLKEKVYGEVSGGSLINCIRGLDGTTAQSHLANAVIEDLITSTHLEGMSEGLLIDHTDRGYHKSLTDDNGATWLERGQVASAVNRVKVSNAAAGNPQYAPPAVAGT